MRKTALLLASIALAMVLAGGAALAASAGAENPGNAEARDAVLDASLKALVAKRGGPPGVIAVVQRGKDREVHAFGVRNLKRDLPMRPGAHMRQASTSKAFNGAVALSLVDDGELSLNDTVGEYLPGLPKSWHEITLRQLLNHTSGLPNFTADGDYLAALSANPTDPPAPRKLISSVEDEPLNFEPGSAYDYSNTDNVAVGLMVQIATGESYERQLQEQVLGPLGLQDTSLPRGANLKPPYIHGYNNDPSQQPPEDLSEVLASGWVWAAGGMVSTPYDFNDFGRGYVGGKLFGRHTQAQQRRVVQGGSSEPPGPGKNSAGLGIFRYETKCGTVLGHTGNYPGYTQFVAASPDGKRSLTVSVNEQLSPVEWKPAVFEALRRAEGRAVCAALADR